MRQKHLQYYGTADIPKQGSPGSYKEMKEAADKWLKEREERYKKSNSVKFIPKI